MKAAPEQINSIIHRVERLEADKSDIAESIKGVYAEAKSSGLDVPVLRKLITLRKKTLDQIAEEECIMDMYKAAAGMS